MWTAHHWQHWLARGEFPDHPWRSYLQRSALTLKGLTYAPTGAICAAATTSLPETIGGNRNYDYRYTWIRDATFALWGMYSLGYDWEAVDFFSFIADLAEQDDDLQIMYGIGGERDLAENELDHLPGYANSRPVRIGNAAAKQRQHDVWGALLDSVYLHSKAHDHIDDRMWPILAKQVNAALEHWRDPDAGIWEVRGEPQHFTSSKIMCWVAADRGARLAAVIGQDAAADKWEKAAEEIKADILTNGVDDARRAHPALRHEGARRVAAARARSCGSCRRTTRGSSAPSARSPTSSPSTAWCCATASRRPTTASAARRARSRSARSGWCRRCARSATTRRARRLCARLLSLAGPLELYAEEIDVHSGAHLGNFPQAFTHLALINAVLHVIATADLHDGQLHTQGMR